MTECSFDMYVAIDSALVPGGPLMTPFIIGVIIEDKPDISIKSGVPTEIVTGIRNCGRENEIGYDAFRNVRVVFA